MASVLTVVDLAQLIPVYALHTGNEYELASELEKGFFPAYCSACGTRFCIELLWDGDNILFNFEDLTCPVGCNKGIVSAADFNEQTTYEVVERFFAAEPDPSQLPPGVLYLRFFNQGWDN